MPMRSLSFVVAASILTLAIPMAASAAPVTVGGDAFTLVATGTHDVQLFGLAADGLGNIYAGNNSNNTTGIPVQKFDRTLFSGAPIPLADYGPNVGDADGIAYHSGNLYVADRDEGVQKISVPGAVASLFLAGKATNPTGSPIAIRPTDGHIFIGHGTDGPAAVDEYTATGAFVATHATSQFVETMTFDPGSGLLYYANFGSSVRKLNPNTDADSAVGSSSGTIDGGLAFDPLSGLLFVGTANGANQGRVETIDVGTGTTTLFATGFNGSTGIIRDPFSGDLYFLESDALYRIDTSEVPTGSVPEPSMIALFGASLVLITLGRLYLLRRRANV